MNFSVVFVDRLVVMVREIVSRKTRKYPNPSNERSETMSTQITETVKYVRVLVSFCVAREDGNVSNELVHEENNLDQNGFKSHVISFTAVQKNINSKGGVDVYSILELDSQILAKSILVLSMTNGPEMSSNLENIVKTMTTDLLNNKLGRLWCPDEHLRCWIEKNKKSFWTELRRWGKQQAIRWRGYSTKQLEE